MDKNDAAKWEIDRDRMRKRETQLEMNKLELIKKCEEEENSTLADDVLTSGKILHLNENQ